MTGFLNTVRLACHALAACLIAASLSASAQDYPTKPVRLVVPTTPGGGTDLAARAIQPKLSEYLGQQVLIDNRPGATTTIGGEFVARSEPDGYTLLMGVSSLTIVPHILRGLRYDPMTAFTPVSPGRPTSSWIRRALVTQAVFGPPGTTVRGNWGA